MMKNLEFKGYRRPGWQMRCVRNHVLVLPTSVCSSDVATMIASQVPEAVYVANPRAAVRRSDAIWNIH